MFVIVPGSKILPIHMSMVSVDNIPITGTLASPSYFTGFAGIGKNNQGFVPTLTGPSADQDTGAIVNNTGRDITMNGSIAYLTMFTGFTGNINVWSERSDDGIVWTPNERSYREWDVSLISGGAVTQKSAVDTWKNGEYLRFAMVNAGGGTLNMEAVSQTVNGGQTVESFSVFWTLDEV